MLRLPPLPPLPPSAPSPPCPLTTAELARISSRLEQGHGERSAAGPAGPPPSTAATAAAAAAAFVTWKNIRMKQPVNHVATRSTTTAATASVATDASAARLRLPRCSPKAARDVARYVALAAAPGVFTWDVSIAVAADPPLQEQEAGGLPPAAPCSAGPPDPGLWLLAPRGKA